MALRKPQALGKDTQLYGGSWNASNMTGTQITPTPQIVSDTPPPRPVTTPTPAQPINVGVVTPKFQPPTKSVIPAPTTPTPETPPAITPQPTPDWRRNPVRDTTQSYLYQLVNDGQVPANFSQMSGLVIRGMYGDRSADRQAKNYFFKNQQWFSSIGISSYDAWKAETRRPGSITPRIEAGEPQTPNSPQENEVSLLQNASTALQQAGPQSAQTMTDLQTIYSTYNEYFSSQGLTDFMKFITWVLQLRPSGVGVNNV